jgi:hypothetical protein
MSPSNNPIGGGASVAITHTTSPAHPKMNSQMSVEFNK